MRLNLKAAVSALTSLFGSNTNQLTRPVSSPMYGWLREPYAGAWQRGHQADPIGSVTSFGAVYACISRIANDVSKLEPRYMQRKSDGTCVPAPDKSPFWGPLRKPNAFQNRIQFYTFWLVCKLLYGNAYVLKQRDDRGMVSKLYLLDPRKVTPMVTPEGDVYYSLGGDDLSRIPAGSVLPAAEIIHDRYTTLWHPLCGVSPIYACGIAATQGNRIQANSANFFENMSRPSGMLTAPGLISDETAERLKKHWEQNYSGQNIGRLAVLGDGLSYAAMTIPAVDAQLIEQLKWTVEDVARAFSMPLYKIGAGPMPTNGNVESLNQQYYSDCLQVHIEAIELCLDEGLSVPARTGVEFDLEGLIRMDQSAQMEMLGNSVKNGVRSPNEARAKLNLPPMKGGSSIYLQQQYFSLEALARRDSKEDPFSTEQQAQPPAAPVQTNDESAAEEQARELIATIQKGLAHV